MTLSTDKTASDLIYLVSCAVNQTQPDPEKCAAMDLGAIYELSRRHMLTAAAALALEQTVELPRAYDQSLKKNIRKLALYNIERAKITAALEAEGIRYMLLKGAVLRKLYPLNAMREMSDNDLLCDGDRMDDVRRVMEGLGYTCALSGEWIHDVYQKPPSLDFEMHSALFEYNQTPRFADYYSDIWERTPNCGGCEYKLRDEDFYLYLLCHTYKHYRASGTGLRSLLDVYVFDRARCEAMDMDYLAAELKKLELVEFEESIRELARAVFSGQPLTDAWQTELNYYIRSGTFGNYQQHRQLYLQNRLNGDDSKQSKRRYLIKRIFISDDDLKAHYPFIHRHKILYPLLLIYRPVKGVFTRPREILREYKTVRSFQKADDLGAHNQ